MKKILCTALLGVLSAMTAHAAENEGPYVGVAFSYMMFDSSLGDAPAGTLKAGYNFNQHWAGEAHINIGEAKSSNDFWKTTQPFGVYGKYTYPIKPAVSVHALAGIAQVKVKANSDLYDGEISSSSTSLTGGVGLDYKVSPKVSLTGDALLHGDATLLSVGANFSF